MSEALNQPHAAERALYWRQRAERRDDVCQVSDDGVTWGDVKTDETKWVAGRKYRVKPKIKTHYFPLVRSSDLMKKLTDYINCNKAIIIGAIESREV